MNRGSAVWMLSLIAVLLVFGLSAERSTRAAAAASDIRASAGRAMQRATDRASTLVMAADGWSRIADVEELIIVPKTGQVECWDTEGDLIDCGGTGQDGDLQMGIEWPAPRFTDNEDGTVTDNLTKLVWLKDPECLGTRHWGDALAAANAMKSGDCGLSDGSVEGEWRLPNVRELHSVVDFSQSWPALPSDHPFIGIPWGHFWSSTTAAGDTTLAWDLHPHWGQQIWAEKAGGLYVWLVRDAQSGQVFVPKTGQTECWNTDGHVIDCDGTGQDGDLQMGVKWPDPRFTDNEDGTVTDNLTKLVWLKDPECLGTRPWSDALAAANTLKKGDCGLSDRSVEGEWRLPNVLELGSLIDYSQDSPALPSDNPFVSIPTGHYWSSTTRQFETSQAWHFGMGSGQLGGGDKRVSLWVWPVRGQQKGYAIRAYLPLALRDHIRYFEGPWEMEPNDIWQEANGPLISGHEYYGYPNDTRDYFSIYTREAGQIAVSLTGHTGQGVQLQLFYQGVDNRVGLRTEEPYQITHTGPAGWYYVYVYTESGHNESAPYTLQVRYPQ